VPLSLLYSTCVDFLSLQNAVVDPTGTSPVSEEGDDVANASAASDRDGAASPFEDSDTEVESDGEWLPSEAAFVSAASLPNAAACPAATSSATSSSSIYPPLSSRPKRQEALHASACLRLATEFDQLSEEGQDAVVEWVESETSSSEIAALTTVPLSQSQSSVSSHHDSPSSDNDVGKVDPLPHEPPEIASAFFAVSR
jgi:hypothetical protein